MKSADIVISGAGAIGLLTALGLQHSGHRITLIDRKPEIVEGGSDDTRMIALSKSSCQLLEELNLWSRLEKSATLIEAVHVSERGVKGSVFMDAKKQGLDSFGALIPLKDLLYHLTEAVKESEEIDYRAETTVIDVAYRRFAREEYLAQWQRIYSDDEFWGEGGFLTLKRGEALEKLPFDWLISAEGEHSQLRHKAGIEAFYQDYPHAAVIARGRFNLPHEGVAYERFTSDKPLALLPINRDEMAIILITPRAEFDFWQSASEEHFIKEVMSRLPASVGTLEAVSKRHSWKLSFMQVDRLVQDRLILVGNSAHALHPIAGQGLNLGVRDVASLLPLFSSGKRPTSEALESYNRARMSDIKRVSLATNTLLRFFDPPAKPLAHLRSVALWGVEYLPLIKRSIANFGMGLTRRGVRR